MKAPTNHAQLEHPPRLLPIIPTMDVVVFPHMIVPLLILDERIIKGITESVEESKKVLLLATKKQVDGHDEAIGTNDLYHVGTVATIMRLIKIPDGGVKILVQGVERVRVHEIITEQETISAFVESLESTVQESESELKAHIKSIKDLAEKISISGQSFSPDFHLVLAKMHDPAKITDFVLSHLNLDVETAQKLLEKDTQAALLDGIYHELCKEVEIAEAQERIKNNARDSINQSQKEYFLREQLKAIKKELGDDESEEIEAMRTKLTALKLAPDIDSEIKKQINRLEKTSPDSVEASVTRNYIDWVLALPWNHFTEDNLDLERAQRILDEDHYGLSDIKERILDFISIRKLKQDSHAPILCFVGPPGTGKTSLAQSIAASLGRKHFRVSLGGVRDEAEIRGHRRTYVGSMPGRFIQGIRKAGSSNPIIIMDELDKVGADFRGDPSAALLEVLDPQQNHTFYDNYLGLPFDLSKVMFIATANSLDTISAPLRDRMEIIQLSGYTMDEKISIAQKYITKKALADSGLADDALNFNHDVLTRIIEGYTRESGVRNLERTIRKLCSKAARIFVQHQSLASFDLNNLDPYLGIAHFDMDNYSHENMVGISNGLAWTSVGGEMLKIEAILMPGTGKLMLTGQLGNVMKESAQAALSYARAHAQEFNIDNKMFTKYDLHIHAPAGGIPKDGPSAGITMLSSILSVLTGRAINANYAMTGEINLRGDVMPIGGVKEKVLAAKRNGMQHVILPEKNRKDLQDIKAVAEGIDIVWVKHADEVIEHILLPLPGAA